MPEQQNTTAVTETATTEKVKRTRKNLSKNVKDMNMEELKALVAKQQKEINGLQATAEYFKGNAEKAYEKVRYLEAHQEDSRQQALRILKFVKTNVETLFTTIRLLEKEI